jgi:FAD-dependent urate hydroxylase
MDAWPDSPLSFGQKSLTRRSSGLSVRLGLRVVLSPARSCGYDPALVADGRHEGSHGSFRHGGSLVNDVEVAIVGAGPHGLSAAVHLRRAGVHTQVFGEPMSFWRAMPEGMKLRSNMGATNMIEPAGELSLQAYMADSGVEISPPVPLAQFVDYGMWVQAKAVPDLDNRMVTRIERQADDFSLCLRDGERFSSRRVVIACGIARFARIPSGFEHFPSELVSHTSDHADPAVFAGRRVAVVGGGQSAFECAALMRERGARVDVLVRSPEIVWLRRVSPKNVMGAVGPIVYAPTDVGPAWYSRLVAVPDLFRQLPRRAQTRIASRSIRPACSHFVRVRLDDVDVALGVTVDAAEVSGAGLRLSLSDGTQRDVDHLMFGTGYRVDITRYPFLTPDLLGALRVVDGYPVLHRGLESSVPGLHMVGAPAAWSFGPILRFVSGSWYAGKSVARAVVTASTLRSVRA